MQQILPAVFVENKAHVYSNQIGDKEVNYISQRIHINDYKEQNKVTNFSEFSKFIENIIHKNSP